jgi:hypothetical protein
MLFLSEQEKVEWAAHAKAIVTGTAKPSDYEGTIRSNLQSAFCYYIGTLLAMQG